VHCALKWGGSTSGYSWRDRKELFLLYILPSFYTILRTVGKDKKLDNKGKFLEALVQMEREHMEN